MPALIPVTTPNASTVPVPGTVLLQVPPPVKSVSAVVAPAQTVAVPVIAAGVAGNEFTVTIVVAAILPQLFDSV